MSEPKNQATSTNEAAAPPPQSTSTSSKKAEKTAPNKKKKPPEFNPRWKGYLYIGFTSLLNFASISQVATQDRHSYWAASMMFGILTFALSFLVLAQDRSQRCMDVFNYTKARDGYFEGYALLFTVVWWIIGTGYQTRADGIAYLANNIYFSSWLALGSCISTLNEWSASKDILSIAEMTGLSATLKSWYVVFLSSLVVLGTSIDLHVRVRVSDLGTRDRDDTAFGIGLGTVSTIISVFWIFTHYDFVPNCKEGKEADTLCCLFEAFQVTKCLSEESNISYVVGVQKRITGGWLELSSSFFLIGLYIVGLAILTQDEGIAATISGSQCLRNLDILLTLNNCTIVYWESNTEGNITKTVLPCTDVPRQVPGSNLYLATWACFLSSFNVTLRWKAAQALNLAQAQEEKERGRLDDGDGQENDDFSDGSDNDF